MYPGSRRCGELASPDQKRVVEHHALLEIVAQSRAWTVGIPALAGKLSRKVDVLIPASMHELDEPDSAFSHAPRQQAVAGEAAIALLAVNPVHVEDVLRLIRDIGQLGNGGLH